MESAISNFRLLFFFMLVLSPVAVPADEIPQGNKEVAKSSAATDGQKEPAEKSQDRDDDQAEDEANAEETDSESEGDNDGDGDDTDNKDESKEESDDDEKDKKTTLTGYFAPQKHKLLILKPQGWTSFTVVEAVPHGTEVRKGDPLVKFDTRKIDEAIDDLEAEMAASKITLMESEHKLEVLKKMTPLKVTKAERSERIASENLKRFLTIKRSSRKRSLEKSVANAENWLMYQQEELDQLQKMYEADDLTEETEEIILLRTRHDVENAEYSLVRTKESFDESLNVDLPRLEENLENSLQEATLALEEARVTLPAQLEAEELKMQSRHLKLERQKEQLSRLREDRELMTLEAPLSGVVYYGKEKQGKWSDPSTMAAILQPGGTAKPNQPLLTVVKLAPLHITAWMEEKELADVAIGATGTVKPTAFPDREFAATVVDVAKVPSGSKYPATLELEDGEDLALVPGMTCKIEFEREPSNEADDESKED